MLKALDFRYFLKTKNFSFVLNFFPNSLNVLIYLKMACSSDLLKNRTFRLLGSEGI